MDANSILNYLSQYGVLFIFIIVFLALQAVLDLSLPTYTSDIVNNGIVNNI